MKASRYALLALLALAQGACGDDGTDDPNNGGAGGGPSSGAGTGGAQGGAGIGGGGTFAGGTGGANSNTGGAIAGAGAGAGTAGAGGSTGAASSGGSAGAAGTGTAGGVNAATGNRLASFFPGMCALNTAGKILCWGSDPSSPGAWNIPQGSFTALAAAGLVCAIGTDRLVSCFVPPGLTDDPSRSPAGAVLQIAMSPSHICSLDVQGRVHCDDLPGTPSSGTFLQVSVGSHFACAIRSEDRQVRCWGDPSLGGCEPKASENGQLSPPSGPFKQIASGLNQSCGIRDDGSLACWGAGEPSDDPAELLCGRKLHYGQSTPPSGAYSHISVGSYHACAVRTNGSIACWGAGEQAGACMDIGTCGQAAPPAETGFVEVLAGNSNSCGLKSDGKVRCWGANTFGRSTPPPELQ